MKHVIFPVTLEANVICYFRVHTVCLVNTYIVPVRTLFYTRMDKTKPISLRPDVILCVGVDNFHFFFLKKTPPPGKC